MTLIIDHALTSEPNLKTAIGSHSGSRQVEVSMPLLSKAAATAALNGPVEKHDATQRLLLP